MNEEIISKNKLAYKFFYVGIACFFLSIFMGQFILLLGFFACSLIWFFMQNPSRYCDYCGNYLQYFSQQIKISNNIACKTCDKKYRIGKIGMNDTVYKSQVNQNGYGK